MATGTEGGVEVPKPDAGFMFKAEMFVMNILLGYAKVFVGVAVLVLLGALVIGQYQEWYRADQRDTAAQVATAERDLKAALLAALPEGDREQAKAFGLGVIDLLRIAPTMDEATRAAVVTAAQAWMAASAQGRGMAAAESALRAADLFRRVGMPAEQRAALERAAAVGPDEIGHGATLALAALDLDEEALESALTRMKAVMEAKDGFVSERAALDLGAAYEAAERDGEAMAVYQQFAALFPGSSLSEEASARLAKLQGSPG